MRRVVRVLPLALMLSAGGALAQPYPVKPIRVLIPFSAGSASDILARALSPRLHEAWGQPLIADNRPSAGGTVAGSIVANATADGYTLLLTSSAFAGSAALYDKLPYDSVRDFAPVTQIATTPMVLVVAPALGVKTLKELVALAKQKPKQLSFASNGIGSGTQYAAELFNYVAGIQAVHVPYRGVPEALNDTLSGRTQYCLAPILPSMGLIRGGRLLPLAISTTQRSALLPDVPTSAEAGVAGYEYDGWYGLLAPAKTPPAVIATLNGGIARVLELPEIREKIQGQGATVKHGTPQAFGQLIREEIVTRRKVFAAAGVKPE